MISAWSFSSSEGNDRLHLNVLAAIVTVMSFTKDTYSGLSSTSTVADLTSTRSISSVER